jgi:ParB/RepB/Spo0J family partition protein
MPETNSDTTPAAQRLPLGMPAELLKKGWRLSRSEGKFRSKNKELGLFSAAMDTPELAIAAARELDAGKTEVLTGAGEVEFKSPLSDFVIRCPECGDSDGLQPHFTDQGKHTQRIVSFTCSRGHLFADENGKIEFKEPDVVDEISLEGLPGNVKIRKTKPPSTLLAQKLPNFCLLERKDLQSSRTNARQNFDETKLQELAESIRAQGILEPLIVRQPRPGKYEIVAGERRYRAAGLVNLHWLPCIVRNVTDKEAEEIQTIENDQREDLNPIERGAGYLKLIERHGHTPETLAAAVNKSKTFIYDQIKLAKLPERARKALLAGKLPQSTATLIGRIPSETYRENAAKEIVRDFNPSWPLDPLSFREAKSLIERKYSLQLKGTPFSREDATLVPAAGACTTCPKLTGNNRTEFPDGRADVCTDPQCFNSKIAAFDARTRTKAKEQAIKVLPASATRAIFSSYGNGLSHNSGYIDLADQCELDKQKKKRSYKQLLGEAAGPVTVMAIDRNHRAHFLVPEKDAGKILEKNHQIKIKVVASSSRSSAPRKDPEVERKRKLDADIFERAVQLAAREIAHQAEVSLFIVANVAEAAFLKSVALMYLDNVFMACDNDAKKSAAERLGLISAPSPTKKKEGSKYVSCQKLLEKFALNSMTAGQVFGLALEIEFGSDAFAYGRGTRLDERHEKILKIFPRVGDFKTYLLRAKEDLTKTADVPPAAAKGKTKAKGAGR